MSQHTFLFDNDAGVELSFRCWGGNHGEFAKALESVSSKISHAERKVLLDYWGDAAPDIVMENTQVIQTELHGSPYKAAGLNENESMVLRFAGLAISDMPSHIVGTLVAHEFAHAVLNAELKTKTLPVEERKAFAEIGLDMIDDENPDTDKLGKQLNDWHEAFADKRSESWNNEFDCEQLRVWWKQYVTGLA